MLNKLTLTNWRQHASKEIEFTAGVQAIRGANEAGKSSVLWAIAYAWFGTRAVPVPFSELVTWGQAEATLKVELTFNHDGKSYTIIRKKSGAELAGGGVTASGHDGVSRFVEGLFGATAPLVLATMIASQRSLQDGLGSGSVSLIEDLSDMSLIDDLINKVSTDFLSGNTKAITAQLATFEGLEEPVQDFSKFETLLAQYRTAQTTARSVVEDAQEKLIGLQKAVQEIENIRTGNKAVEQLAVTLDADIASLLPRTQIELTPVEDPAHLQGQLAEAETVAKVVKAHADFLAEQWPASMFDVPASELQVSVSSLSDDIASCNASIADLKVAIARDSALKVTASACGLCGKDLTEVPEVVSKNAQLEQAIGIAKSKIDALRANLDTLGASRAQMVTALNLDQSIRKACAPYKGLFELSDDNVPCQVGWCGPDVSKLHVNITQAEVSAAVAKWNKYRADFAALEAAKSKLDSFRRSREALAATPEPEDAAATLAAYAATLETIRLFRELYDKAEKNIRISTQEMDKDKAIHAEKLSAYRRQVVQRQEMLATLAEMNENNVLIDRLREARPAVAKELWQLVLVAVSHYFSQIRGQVSIVTRTDKSFSIDGKPLATFSGSTQDALGLAVRLVLLKTFLPNLNFLIVDEPGAACDESRESDMLGVLATSGLEQVLVVTHSTLADSFAANVIHL